MATVIAIPTGLKRLGREELEYVKKAESAGLLTVREIPQAYWDSFLTRTQGMGTPFELVRTSKLESICGFSDPKNGCGIPIVKMKLDKVLTDEEYKGSLATPGEKHRLVLGTLRNTPTAEAAVVGPDLAKQEEYLTRFRCVLKYSEFKKEWSVVVIDLGSLDPERWYTSNVK